MTLLYHVRCGPALKSVSSQVTNAYHNDPPRAPTASTPPKSGSLGAGHFLLVRSTQLIIMFNV